MVDRLRTDAYEENAFPLAYLLTFRTYGTWLHGDVRGSYQRSRDPRFRTIKIDQNVPLHEKMHEETGQPAVVLDTDQRAIIFEAIAEVCEHRPYSLRALNVRTNHAHVVVSAFVKPEKIVNDFKAYSTRALRRKWSISSTERVWSRGASTRYLWKPAHVDGAIDYVLYCQEDIPFDFK